MNIEKLLPGIKQNILLKNYTTFKIGGPSRYFFLAKNKEDLIGAIGAAKKLNIPFFILGNGSNLLVSDNGFSGLVIKMANNYYKIAGNKIYVGAGVLLSQLVCGSAAKNLSGLEWASGIPGSIGGAIRGNAGAFGSSMAAVIRSVEALELKSKLTLKRFKLKDCQFSYRNSIFKNNPNLIILSCELQLEKAGKRKIAGRLKEYAKYRRERQPQGASAGSVFKNVAAKKISPSFFKKFPEAKEAIKKDFLPAGYLIAQCGLGGKKNGGAEISKKHSNFIVNFNNAKAQDVLKLIKLAKQKVKNKFVIQLKEEIQLLGF